MAQQKFFLPGQDNIYISAPAADKLISLADPDACLVYIYILRNSGNIEKDAAYRLKMSSERFSLALSSLARQGLIQGGEAAPVRPQETAVAPLHAMPADELPEYTAADIKREMANGKQFSLLVDAAQKTLGKILSSDDLMRLFGIYDCLKLPPEVILQLISFCMAENIRKYGPQKLPTMRYIEKAAYTWEREGIFTLEKAEEYIKELEAKREKLSLFRRALQITDRGLTPTERRYVEGWISMGFSPDEAAIAFDRTVTQTGKLSWKYMDTIMCNWHKKGLHSVREIKENDSRSYGGRPASKYGTAYPPPTAEDMANMQKILEKIKEG